MTLPLYIPGQGSPQLNQPILYNSSGTIYLDTWKGNLPYGHTILTQEQAKQQIQEKIASEKQRLDPSNPGRPSWNPTSVTGKAILRGITTYEQQLNDITNLSGKFDPSTVGGAPYVIGPNGNLMLKSVAENYMPSPQELARGVKPTGESARQLESGEMIQLPNGAIVPKGSAGDVNRNPLLPAPTGTTDPVLAAFNQQMVQSQPGTLAGATAESASVPTTNLTYGQSGAEVTKLQNFLISQGHPIQAGATGYFGDQTKASLLAWQQKNGVGGPTADLGSNWGPLSIAKANVVSSGGGSTSGTGGGTTNADLDAILANPNLTADMKAAIQAIYDAVESNDADTASRIQVAMKAASEFSDPYFKAQIRLATDSLQRGLTGKEGDLAFAESEKKAALDELRTSTSASKDLLSFEHQQELKNLATKYETDIETTQQNLAATGFTSSSRRARAEGILAEQNQGFVESSTKKYGYETGRLERGLVASETSTAAVVENLRRLNEEGKLDLLRQTEEKVGSSTLGGLGYGNLLGDVGGSIERQKVLDQFQFASNFVF